MVSLGKEVFKYFIGYKYAKKTKPLCMFLQKISKHRKDFDKTKDISFLTMDKKLLEKYNEIWKKVSNIIRKEFDSKPVYNEQICKK